MADLELADPSDEPFRELTLDRFLHEQPARRRAALAVQAVDHEDDRVERSLEIGVFEHHDGILAAELEVQALQRRRALSHDRAAGRRLADERDGADRGMLRRGFAGRFAEPVNRVQHTGRQSGRGRNLGEQRRRDGAPLGRLVHDGAAGSQSRRDLPRRQHERRVPGRDRRDRAERLAHRVIDVLARRQRQAALRFGRFVGKEPKILGAALRGRRHEANRLTGVDRFEQRDLFRPRLDRVGDVVQQIASVAAREIAPGRERALRGLRGRRNIRRVAGGDGREQRVVQRRAVLERLPGYRRPCRAVDEVLHTADAQARQVLLRFGDVAVERTGATHGLPPRRLTYSCRLFFLKFSTG